MTTREHRIGSLNVPPLALGTMYFGTTVAPDTARECLDAADGLGARFWDTANSYAFWAGGDGDDSETVLGDWSTERVTLLRAQAAAVGLDAGQLVLAWMGQRDTPVIPIVGVSRPEQMHSAWEAVTTDVPPGMLANLEDARS